MPELRIYVLERRCGPGFGFRDKVRGVAVTQGLKFVNKFYGLVIRKVSDLVTEFWDSTVRVRGLVVNFRGLVIKRQHREGPETELQECSVDVLRTVSEMGFGCDHVVSTIWAGFHVGPLFCKFYSYPYKYLAWP